MQFSDSGNPMKYLFFLFPLFLLFPHGASAALFLNNGSACSTCKYVSSTLVSPTTDFTVDGWVFVNSVTNGGLDQRWVVMFGDASSNYWALAQWDGTANHGNHWQIQSTLGNCTGNATTTAGNWYYLEANRQSSSGKTGFTIWNTAGAVVSSCSTTGTSGAFNYGSAPHNRMELGDNASNHMSGFDGYLRNLWISTTYLTDGYAALSRSLASNPIYNIGASSWFWPLTAFTDNRELIGFTATTFVNFPTNGLDPQLLPYVY